MSKITDFDKNFLVETELKKDDIHFYNAKQSPFHINGLLFENGHFRRIPEAVAGTVSPGVEAHHLHTAGGRIRFRTNSDYIAIQAKMSVVNRVVFRGALQRKHHLLGGVFLFEGRKRQFVCVVGVARIPGQRIFRT